MSFFDRYNPDFGEPLQFLADASGLGVDEVNYVVCMLLSYPLGGLFRFIPASNPALRHIVGIFFGLVFSFFCFRIFMIHTIFSSLVVYLIILADRSGKYVHKLVFVFMMAYMVLCHIYRQYYSYGQYILDVTGPQMILTQKLTVLGFSVHDGLYRKKRGEKLNDLQEASATTVRPSFLEFWGHVFFFPGYLAGPAHFFSDYVAFIKGEGVHGKAPTAVFACFKKILAAFLCIAIAKVPGILGYNITLQRLEDELFHQEHSLPLRFVFLWAASLLVRMKYYFAWILADGGNNAAGFGYQEVKGKGSWDLVSNVKVLHVEMATSLKSVLDNWNIQTQKWLRYVMYDRTRSVFYTMFLSALWHGLYPGYFLTFLTAAFQTEGARKFRSTLRPWFLKTVGQRVYDVMTFFGTCVILNYLTLPFVLLEFDRSIKVWHNLYYSGHIIIILCLVFIRPTPKPKPSPSGETAKTK